MPNELRRLLNSHEFFQQAIRDYRSAMSREHLEGLQSDRDRVFDELVNLKSSQPNVTLAQINFLLLRLVELAPDQKEAERLRKACSAKAQTLAKIAMGTATGSDRRVASVQCSVAGGPTQPIVTPGDARLLDSMSDRAAICDREFRYLFTNKANAAFHGMPADEFIGRSTVSVVGKKVFENVTKPVFSRCFAGETVSVTVGFQGRGRSVTYAARCEPIRDENGAVVAGMLISRDVSELSVEPESVWRLRKLTKKNG